MTLEPEMERGAPHPLRYCEFGHFMMRTTHAWPLPAHYRHVYEDEALHCAALVSAGLARLPRGVEAASERVE